MAFKTRKPTGKPPWPIGLIAGVEKSGKSYACAKVSASELIDRTLWIGAGEDDPDEYGAIPGARFEIVEHAGDFDGILQAARDAAKEPSNPARPNLIVIDSGTCIWDLLTDNAQAVADKRERNKGQISMDLWNKAGTNWRRLMDALRSHNGPVLITTRLEQVTVMKNGKPTTEKEWKIKAHKSLPFDVGFIIELTGRGEAAITGARSLRHDVPLGERRALQEFDVEQLWRTFGFGERDATGPRIHAGTETSEPAPEPATDEPATVPDNIRETVERVKGTPEAADYIAWARNNSAPPHIIQYIETELKEGK